MVATDICRRFPFYFLLIKSIRCQDRYVGCFLIRRPENYNCRGQVSAAQCPQVKKESGFSVVYGPIRSADLPAFIDNGMKATEEMRRVTFPLRERMAVAPVEIVGALKVLALVMPAFFFLSGLFGPFDYWINTSHTGFLAVAALIAALIGGTLLVPLL